MISKTTIVTSATGLLTFLFGWFLHSIIMRPIPANNSKQISDTVEASQRPDKVEVGQNNDLTMRLSGHFILKEAKCAGFDFVNRTSVLWTNEVACNDPDTLQIRWLDNATFMTKSTKRMDQDCPPKVDIYQVLSFDGKHLSLKSIWTGWHDLKDDHLDFIKQGN